MRRVKFWLQLVIILVVFLYTGCTPRGLWQVSCPDGAVMGPDIEVADADDGRTQDAGKLSSGADVETVMYLDAATDVISAAVQRDATDVSSLSDGSMASRDALQAADGSTATLENGVGFLALPATFCADRRLSLSDEWRRLMSEGARVWHVCYQTPSRMTSRHPLATERSERVDARVYHPETGWRTVGSFLPPRTANPWTVSFLLLVQTGEAPRLNLFNRYVEERELAAVSSLDGIAFPTVHGTMRLWEVAGMGEQTPVPLRPICWHRVRAGQPAFFLPDLRCTTRNRLWCEEERLYDCRDP